MEWNNGAGGGQPVNKPAAHASGKKKVSLMSLRTASVALLICVALLIASVAGFTALFKGDNAGSKVKKDLMQAVFLNGGQVYFGKITHVGNRTLGLSDIYYLRVNQTVQPNQENSQQQANSNDISLVKLGCELHGPEDSMVINQDQIIFWENLKNDGQVAKAVETYKKQNPGEQKCETNTNNNSNTNNTTETNNANNPSNTNETTNPNRNTTR